MTPTREEVERHVATAPACRPNIGCNDFRACACDWIEDAAALLRVLLARAEAAEAELAVEQEARELASESDAGWEQVANAARAECERLRLGGCARGQTTTQWCAEAVQMMTERDAARAEAERLREALELIERLHIPSQPMAMDMDEVTWAQRHVGNLRGIARKALRAALATEARDE